jgi:hypothetical protein
MMLYYTLSSVVAQERIIKIATQAGGDFVVSN